MGILPPVLPGHGAFAVDWLGHTRQFRARIWCHDPGRTCGDGGCLAVGASRLATVDSILHDVRRSGVVVRRQHLVHAGGWLYSFRSLALGPLWLRLPVRDRLLVGG